MFAKHTLSRRVAAGLIGVAILMMPIWAGNVSEAQDDPLYQRRNIFQIQRISGVHTRHLDECPGNTLGHHSFITVYEERVGPEN